MRSQIIRNFKWVDKFKIFISMAYYGGNYPYKVINAPIFGDRATACTETYLVIGPFDDKETKKM